MPTVGVGKTLLHVDGLCKDEVKEQFARETDAGEEGREGDGPRDHTLLVGESGRVWGAAFKSHRKSTNPVFLSVGHGMTIGTALALTRRLCRARVPEPVRQADLRSRAYLRDKGLA